MTDHDHTSNHHTAAPHSNEDASQHSYMILFYFSAGLGIAILLLFLLTPRFEPPIEGETDTYRNSLPVAEARYEGEEAPTPNNERSASSSTTTERVSSQSSSNTSPADIYKTSCAACHQMGVLNAPKLGDQATWKARIIAQDGLEHLIDSALNGKNAMPPRGGAANLSDEEIAATVKWMIEQTP